MKILILGSGGREHTLAWSMAQSPLCEHLYVAPGNAGTEKIAENIKVDILDFDAVKKVIEKFQIDFVVVGPEAPLVDGIVDYFMADPILREIPILGPDRVASQLEGSKSFAKSFMSRHHISTAGYMEVTKENIQEGLLFLESLNPPYVLKADGLAAGKGVLIIDDLGQARRELHEMLEGKFGAASEKVVIEEFLDGIEFSVFALTDGKQFVLLPEAKDYKRIGEGDSGLNTGGMGSVSPVPFYKDEFKEKVLRKVVRPTIQGIKEEGLHYRGFVFFGLIKVDGEPYLIEYNCRMGDPETQSVLYRVKSDLVEPLYDAACGKLADKPLDITTGTACAVVAVSGGYPESYSKGKVISGLDESECIIFHAGTTLNESGDVLTNGGRVLAVTSLEDNLETAIVKARDAVSKINYEGIYFRNDIGQDLLKNSSMRE